MYVYYKQMQTFKLQGISLLSAMGKLYGRVLIDRIRTRTDGVLGQEHCGFRSGRGCLDNFFCGEAVVCKVFGR